MICRFGWFGFRYDKGTQIMYHWVEMPLWEGA